MASRRNNKRKNKNASSGQPKTRGVSATGDKNTPAATTRAAAAEAPWNAWWLWLLATVVVLAGGIGGAATLGHSRAVALVIFLVTAALALAIIKQTCADKSRTDKYLEYGIIVLCSALMINIITNLVWEGWIKKAPPAADELYTNHDLARLGGMTITAILQKSADLPQNQSDQKALLRIADNVLQEHAGENATNQPRFLWEQWLKSAQQDKGMAGADVGEHALVHYVRNPQTKALTIDLWKAFLTIGAAASATALQPGGCAAAAERLHTEFGTTLREALKHDYASGGDASKAFAAMQLDVMRELLGAPRLILYHLKPAGLQEITNDYAGVGPEDTMRIKAEGVDGKHWCILTIGGDGAADIYTPDQLDRDEQGLWAWKASSGPSETVILLASADELTSATRDEIKSQMNGLRIMPTLDVGEQINWGEGASDARGWTSIIGGRGTPGAVSRSAQERWTTLVCDQLNKISGVRFDGRTIGITKAGQ